MARKKIVDLVGVVMGPETTRSRAANQRRASLLCNVIGDVRDSLEREIDATAIKFFVPQVRALIERDANWVARMLRHVEAGRGVSQEVYARLCVVLSRMPDGTCRELSNLAPTPSRITMRNPQWPAKGAKYLRFEPGNAVHAEPVNDPKSWAGIEEKS